MKKILVIDDEPDFRELMRVRLITNWFKVIEAEDGPSGVRLARQEQPDLILLDLMIPGKDGILTYQALRADPITKNIPVIFLTALTSTAVEDEESIRRIALTKHDLMLEKDYFVMGKTSDSKKLVRMIQGILAPLQEGQVSPKGAAQEQ